MFTLSGPETFVTSSYLSATPQADASTLAPGAFVVMIVVVILLGWSFRIIGRTLADLAGMLKLLVNVAFTAFLLVGALAVVVAWMFYTAAQS
jgi:hypothetical protein